MIARRLRDKQARGEPIALENFVIDTITDRIGLHSVLLPLQIKLIFMWKALHKYCVWNRGTRWLRKSMVYKTDLLFMSLLCTWIVWIKIVVVVVRYVPKAFGCWALDYKSCFPGAGQYTVLSNSCQNNLTLWLVTLSLGCSNRLGRILTGGGHSHI